MAKSASPKKSKTVVLAGGESLLGRDLREALATAGLKVEVRTAASVEPGQVTGLLTGGEDEAEFLGPLLDADLQTAAVVILAGTRQEVAGVWKRVRRIKSVVVIDATGSLDEESSARIRAPLASQQEPKTSALTVIAHPAAIALALFLNRLVTAGGLERCVVEIFEPASEQGQRGLDELRQQTAGLLSFKKLSKDVYDTQVSFNLLPEYGADAPEALGAIQSRIERQLATLVSLTENRVMPSIRLIQAPVFHGYSFSVWALFDKEMKVPALRKALASSAIEVREEGQEAPTNVGAAGQSGITVGSISVDRNEPRAYWFWIVADNFRLAADNAVEAARAALG